VVYLTLIIINVLLVGSPLTHVFADACAITNIEDRTIAGEGDMMSECQKQLLREGILYFDVNDTPANNCSGDDGGVGVVGTGTLPKGVPEPYNGLITAASAKFGSSAELEAALLYWENRGFPPTDKKWATSSAGAQGPMQFLPATFNAYAVDGNNDGKKNINNVADALYTAANMLAQNGVKQGTPLGTLDKPLAPNTLLRAAASYNWGPGNVQSAGENASLSDLPKETSDYLKAVFLLISSNFTQSPISGSGTPHTDSGDGEAFTAGVGSEVCDTAGTPLGEGTGKFTDNTSVAIPGVEQALARAKQYASESISELGSTICTGGEGSGCYNQCDRLAANVWGHATSGSFTAYGHWKAAVAAGTAHPGDRNAPVGALLFYKTAGGDGHVATYLGNNKVLSNDVKGAGGVYIVDAQEMENWLGSSASYLGWVNPVPWATET
jgi:hypothetical protein